MSTLDLCQEYFGTRDVYALFQVEKDATSKDIKKAYYKLSLQVHPDRVNESEKKIATEKFQVLSKVYQVLTDRSKRAVYDEQNIIDDDDLESKLTSWLDLWRKIFKPITEEDINNYEKTYTGSELERSDIKKAYLSGKGCINYMMNNVPFLKIEDEPRLQDIVGKMIADGEVPEFKMFTEESAQKRQRRHKKYARELKESEEILSRRKQAAKSNDASGSSLEQQMMERHKSREDSYNTLMDSLLAKYGGEDESASININDLGKPSKKKKGTINQTSNKKLRAVKNGKVKKRDH